MLTREFREKSLPWIFVLITVVLINTALLWWYHDRTWWGPDDGQLAHIAERILEGEVLHRDIQDVRPGYVNFINAAALYVFGPSLLSLRYPLAFIVLIQSILFFFLFRFHGAVLAGVLALSSVTLGVLHYINPNHHWYALFFTVVLICHLVWTPRTSRIYLPLAGLLIVTIGLTRHLSGAFVGMGVLSYLLFEESRNLKYSYPWREQWMGRLLCGSMIALLSLYLWRSTDALAFFMFGIWPLSFLAWQLTTAMVPNEKVIRILGGLLLGIVIGALPLLSYHAMNSSLGAMIDDNIIRALDVLNWQYTKKVQYWMMPFAGMVEFTANPKLTSLLNALYFLALPLFAALNGFLLILAVRRRTLTKSLALPVLAAFYGLVSLFNQIPTYLYLTSILSIAGSLWLILEFKTPRKKSMIAMLLFLSGMSLAFHAGEPSTRSLLDHMRTAKAEFFDSRGQLPHVDLWIEKDRMEAYRRVIRLIEKETDQGDYLFAIPNNSELYFMTERRNPFRFFSTDHGVLNASEVENVIQRLQTLRPRIITFAPDSNRNTTQSFAIMAHVREHSKLLSKDTFFEVYLYGEQSRTEKVRWARNWQTPENRPYKIPIPYHPFFLSHNLLHFIQPAQATTQVPENFTSFIELP